MALWTPQPTTDLIISTDYARPIISANEVVGHFARLKNAVSLLESDLAGSARSSHRPPLRHATIDCLSLPQPWKGSPLAASDVVLPYT